MPRLSVVIPVYNVERYLGECLDSVLAQTFGDYEVIVVDDGSTDGSAAVAEEYVARDERIRLVRQENGGLSKARNTGIDVATGEYLAFLDSDDALPPDAYELLVGTLDRTGSDFATGNVYRFTRFATHQSRFLARTFTETRLKTHVTKHRPLLADRTAWNKVWRRSFWTQHGLRFPEGVVHEDIPVVVPAHFMARSVDVLEDPVYYWRARESGGLSITQRRLELRVLRDRLAAVEQVTDYLDAHGPRGSRRWYEASVVADDLRLHLNLLDEADEEYLALFLDRVNAYLDRAGRRIYDELPAIERLKWHLVRRRLVPELFEVLRFQREELWNSVPLRIRGRWYGDYPFRTDERLKIPSSVYRLGGEFALAAAIEDLTADAGGLRVSGYAYIAGIGVADRRAQRLDVSLVRRGRLRRVRLMVAAVHLPARAVHRPDVTANARQPLADASWSGFEASLSGRAARRVARRPQGLWDLYVTVRAGGIKRRRSRFLVDAARPVRPARLDLPGELHVTAALTRHAELELDVHRGSATVRGGRLDGDTLELVADVRPAPDTEAVLELRRDADGRRLRRPLRAQNGNPGGLAAQVPLAKLRSTEESSWAVSVVQGGRRLPAHPAVATSWLAGGREIALTAAGRGATLVERRPRPVVEEASWTRDGDLHLVGRVPEGATCEEIAVVRVASGESYRFPAGRDATGRFVARLMPARVQSLGGALPLADGSWELHADGVPLVFAPDLERRLPLSAVRDHKPFALALSEEEVAILRVRRDLDEDERGPYHQRRLRSAAYAPARNAPLRDAVVYSSFQGRQYSDSPRAIHEELVRRGAPLEHLWVVSDGRCRVPETATVLREGSREHYEAMGRARYVVANDGFPDWFARREDQICLQTGHATPIKRVGLEIGDHRPGARRLERRWRLQLANWQYVLSPSTFATPILRRAFEMDGSILETGYPRVDVLSHPDREQLGLDVRRRLGVEEGQRVVLYAPTYRDHVMDRFGRFRLEVGLDLERLRDAVGDDTVLLFRKHQEIFDALPPVPGAFVRDVTAYPEATELLLAADVLVTDYSSVMADFANTGKPMLFYAYDLETYANEVRGFTVDFAETIPGPLLRTTDELAEALREVDAVAGEYEERYARFRAMFCDLDDGHATERVVDRLMS